MFIRFLQVGMVLLGASLILTQLIIPAVRNRMLFPLFRPSWWRAQRVTLQAEADLEETLAQKKATEDSIEADQEAVKAIRRSMHTKDDSDPV